MKYLIIPMALLTLSSCQSKNSKPEKGDNKAAYSQFGIESVSKDDLKKYAPKEISASMKNKISLYMDIQTPAGGQLHPNGKDLFFNWRISGYQQIWKMSGPNTYPVQMTGGKDLTTLANIAPNGQFIIFHRDIDGQENPGIYIQSVAGGPLTKIFHEPKVRAAFQFITDDSKEIYFTSNHEDAQSFFVYKINIETKKIEPISKEKGYWYIMDHEGDRLLLGFAKTSFANDVYELNLKTKEKKWLLGEKSEDPFDVRFLRANNKYIVRTLDGDFETLKLLDNGKLKNIIKTEKHDIENFELSDNRDFLAYELNKDGYTQLNFFKITSEGALSEVN